MPKSLKKPENARQLASFLCALDNTKSQMKIQASRQVIKRLIEEGAAEMKTTGDFEYSGSSLLSLLRKMMAMRSIKMSMKKAVKINSELP